MAAAPEMAGEPRRRHHHDLGAAIAGLGALRVGDARDSQRRLLGRRRARDELGGIRLCGVVEVQPIRRRQRRLLGEAAEFILRHDLRHRHRPLGELVEPGGIDGAGRNHGAALADEDAQAKIAPLGPLQVLGLAQPPLHPERGAGEQHGVGHVGAGAFGTCEQVGEEVEWFMAVTPPAARRSAAPPAPSRPAPSPPASDGRGRCAPPPAARPPRSPPRSSPPSRPSG